MGRRTIGVFHAAPRRASVTRAAEGPTRGSAEQIATIGVLRQLVRNLTCVFFRLCAVEKPVGRDACAEKEPPFENANGPDTAKIVGFFDRYGVAVSRMEGHDCPLVAGDTHHDTQKRGEHQILGMKK